MERGEKNRRKDPKKERCWRRRITQWQQSHQTIRAYCREHGFPVSTFDWWRREVERRDKTRVSVRSKGKEGTGGVGEQALFLPVRIIDSDHAGKNSSSLKENGRDTAIEIYVDRGRTIGVRSGFDGETLARVLSILDRSRC